MSLGLFVQPLEPLGQPGRNGGAAAGGEVRDLLEAVDRLDARHDRRDDAGGAGAFDIAQIIAIREEHLGDGPIGAGVDLALEIVDLGLPVRALRVLFGIGGHRNVEVADPPQTAH
ncbi:hypothetical protein D3C72_2181690 [compost metagenome]